MFGPPLFFPVFSSIQTALSQPFFPGKVVMWLLFMLSIVSWVMIISKGLQLRKAKQLDRKFDKRLRGSRTTLEVYETGWACPDSPRYHVYLAGAKEAAYQLLGIREPYDGMRELITEAGQLTQTQAKGVRQSFRSGFRDAVLILEQGMSGFRLIGVSAALLGAIGFVWTLMTGLDAATETAEVMPAVGSSLGFLAVALMVATPAFIAQSAFLIQLKRRRIELRKFHDELVRLFERKFCSKTRDISNRLSAEESPATSLPDDDDPSSGTRGKKRYHSIRERLLRPPSEPPLNLDDLQINPIARQAVIQSH